MSGRSDLLNVKRLLAATGIEQTKNLKKWLNVSSPLTDEVIWKLFRFSPMFVYLSWEQWDFSTLYHCCDIPESGDLQEEKRFFPSHLRSQVMFSEMRKPFSRKSSDSTNTTLDKTGKELMYFYFLDFLEGRCPDRLPLTQ